MKRLGFVRLGRYGLVLTPEGRIMSLRPAVLDDGLANRIVGWQDDDLAAMELAPWSPKPAPATAVASRVAISMPPPAPAYAVPAPRATVEVMTIPVAPPAAVAREGQVEEDEWEWTIALARARAAAEETETQVRKAGSPRRRDTVPPPVTQATLPMIGIKVEPLDTWPKTEPLGTIDYEDYTSARREKPAAPPAPKVMRVPTPPSTIIPVPQLSSTGPTPLPPLPARRLAKGTGSHDPKGAAVFEDKTAVETPTLYREAPPMLVRAVKAPTLPRLPSIVARSR